MPAWGYLLLASVWLVLFRMRRKRAGALLNSSVSAGAVRDLTGRGGF